MFKKLRQKIENVDGSTASPVKEGVPSTPSSVRRNEEGRRGSRALLRKSESLTSLNGSESDMPNESSTKEDLSVMVMNRTAQVKRLEVKLAEYGQSLKERTRECEKLSNALEKQQDNALRKLNELNETYTNNKKRSDATISRLEEVEKELQSSVNSLEEENNKLQTRVDEWRAKEEEFEKQKNEFYEKRDNREELHDLQRQELAKLKHMLMNREKQCKDVQLELDENVANLIQSQDQCEDLEKRVYNLTRSMEETQSSLVKTIQQRDDLQQSFEKSEKAAKKLTSNNVDLKDKLSSLALDLQKARSALSSVETSHSSLSDKYEYLKHSSEAVLNKAQNEAQEKQSLIDHLEHKLKTMEQRSNTEKLPEDEKIKALLDERISLEQKLEESRQQLMNIKSTWSDKINQLETQVTHLNHKLAEDSEELKQKNSELAQVKKEMNGKVKVLSSKLEDLEKSNSDLTSHNDSILQQMAELEATLIEKQALHDLTMSKVKQRESEQMEQSRNAEGDLRTKIKELSNKIKQQDDAANRLENEIKQLKSEKEAIVSSMQSQNDDLSAEMDRKSAETASREKINGEMALSLEEVRRDRDELRKVRVMLEENAKRHQKKLEEALKEVESLTAELNELKEDLQKSESRFQKTKSLLEEAQVELDAKHEGLVRSQGASEEQEDQLRDLAQKLTDLESTLDTRTKELMMCKEEIASLKNNQAEGGEEVKMLRLERSSLEDRLLEKDRTLKLNQQRINDIKKALQKEVNKSKQPERSRSGDPGQQSARVSSSRLRNDDTNPTENGVSRHNGMASVPEVDPIPSLLSGDMSLDDPSLSEGQRDIVVKYLKHVVLKFLSCGQSEAQQLIKAMSAILRFTNDEEKLVREVLDYRSSWFASRPNAKSVLKPSFKGRSRHQRR